jgi:hypothetical protein
MELVRRCPLACFAFTLATAVAFGIGLDGSVLSFFSFGSSISSNSVVLFFFVAKK